MESTTHLLLKNKRRFFVVEKGILNKVFRSLINLSSIKQLSLKKKCEKNKYKFFILPDNFTKEKFIIFFEMDFLPFSKKQEINFS